MRMNKKEVMIPMLLNAWEKSEEEKAEYRDALCRALADVCLLRGEIESKLYSLSSEAPLDLATPTSRASSRRSQPTR